MSIVKAGRGAFGDVISDLQGSQDADTVAGLKVLSMYWNALKVYNPQIPSDFPSFLAGLKDALVPVSDAAKWPGYVGPLYPNNPDGVFQIKVQGLGLIANTGGVPGFSWSSLLPGGSSETQLAPIPDSQLQAAMEDLASKGQGHIMADINQYGAAIQGQVTNPPFLDALWYTIQASTAQTVQAAQQIGTDLIQTGASLLAWRNYLLAAGGLFAAYVIYSKVMKAGFSIKTKHGSVDAR
jgi:hypothetical protein